MSSQLGIQICEQKHHNIKQLKKPPHIINTL